MTQLAIVSSGCPAGVTVKTNRAVGTSYNYETDLALICTTWLSLELKHAIYIYCGGLSGNWALRICCDGKSIMFTIPRLC